MQRLDENTVHGFVRDAEIAALMFGSPESEVTMAQAIEFALAWADSSGSAAFGYVDAFESIPAARAFGVRLLPTTLIVSDGQVVAKLEGRQPSLTIEMALRKAQDRRPIAA